MDRRLKEENMWSKTRGEKVDIICRAFTGQDKVFLLIEPAETAKEEGGVESFRKVK